MQPLLFRKPNPLDHPMSNFKGFAPGVTKYPKGYQVGPEYHPLDAAMILERDVPVKLRDGVTIYIDIFRPDHEEKVPAILCSSIFGKNGSYASYERVSNLTRRGDNVRVRKELMSGFDQWEAPDPGYWVANDYAVIYMDPRGVAMSEGDAHFFGTQDASDNCDVIEYLAQLPWCNGKVSMSGSSWLAITQWYTAAMNPSHLVCINPWEGHGDMYRSEYMRGGIPHISIVREFVCFGQNRAEDLQAEMYAYPLYDDFWKEKACRFEDITIPAYVVGSWNSMIHCQGTMDGFRRISSKEKWLRVHNQQEWEDQQAPQNRADLLKFFDYYMKDKKDNGWEKTPPVRLAILDMSHEDVVNRPEQAFPLERTQYKKLYLDPIAQSLQEKKPPMVREGIYQSDDMKGRLRFTHVFHEDTEVTGYCKFHAFVSADFAKDIDLYARICKIDEDGHYVYSDGIEILYGGPNAMLRVSLRELDPEKSTDTEPYQTFTHPHFLHPDEVVEIEMGFMPTGLKFHKGEALELNLSGFDYLGQEDINGAKNSMKDSCNIGINRVWCGGIYDSYLQIPVIPES